MKNNDKTFIGELQEHYEIGISIYNDLEECNPDIAYLVKEFKYWNHNSICLWLTNGKIYKCTRLDKNNFYVQYLSISSYKLYTYHYLAHISIMRGVYINWVLVIMFIYKVS